MPALPSDPPAPRARCPAPRAEGQPHGPLQGPASGPGHPYGGLGADRSPGLPTTSGEGWKRGLRIASSISDVLQPVRRDPQEHHRGGPHRLPGDAAGQTLPHHLDPRLPLVCGPEQAKRLWLMDSGAFRRCRQDGSHGGPHSPGASRRGHQEIGDTYHAWHRGKDAGECRDIPSRRIWPAWWRSFGSSKPMPFGSMRASGRT